MISLRGIVRRHVYKVFADSVSMITYQSLAPTIGKKTNNYDYNTWLDIVAMRVARGCIRKSSIQN